MKRQLEKATGRKVNMQTTTDYNVAIQALASGKAQLATFGASGYIHAHHLNKRVVPIAAISGPTGTLEGAAYHSYLMVPQKQAAQYQVGAHYAVSKLKGKRFSFVSNTSTSGFVIPSTSLARAFHADDPQALAKPGKYFSKVLYGGSHQGSAVNLFKGDVDAAAFDDTDLRPYLDVTQGDYTHAGSVFSIKQNAPAPFDQLHGSAVAIAVLPVQREPWAVNTKALDQATVKKLKHLFMSKAFNNDPELFSKEGAKHPKLFTKATPQTKLVPVDDAWYKPTHELIGM